MVEINISIPDKKIISDVKTKVKKIDQGRTVFKKQALINIMFLYGKHHFDMKSNYANLTSVEQRIVWEIEAIRKASNVRRVSNYILPLFRSLYSRLIRMKASVHAAPTTFTEKDRDAAKVATEVLEDFWETCNSGNIWLAQDFTGMQSIIMKLVLYMLSIGNGYMIPYYNPNAEAFVYDEMQKDVIYSDVGEAEVRVASPLNIFRDRFGRSITERRFISPEQVYYEYGKDVKPVQGENDLVESQIKRLLEGEINEEDEKEGVYVYTQYSLPNKEHKNGRMIVCTDNELLFNEDMPEELGKKIPVFNCKYQDLGFTSHSQGAIEQVVDLQQDYNETLTRISSYKKLLTGKLLNPRGSKLSTKYDDETGQILNYNKGFKPSYENGAVIPSYIINELMRIRRDMEDAMNSHDTSMGRPGGVKSGVAIDSLSENDFSMISPELITFEATLSKMCHCILGIVEKKYIEPRLIGITGEDMAYEVNHFKGSSVVGNRRISVKMGTGLPAARSERQQYILMLKKEGLISPDRAKKMLEFGDIDGAYTSLDEIGAKQDLLNIIENQGQVEVLAEPFEDHTIRLKVINDFRKGSRYARLEPDIREAIDDLAKQHQEFLLSEQEVSQGGMPAPAIPQQPQ